MGLPNRAYRFYIGSFTGLSREIWLLAGETIATLVVGLLLMPRGSNAIARRPAA